MRELISMVEFVLNEVERKVSVVSHMICIENYANFLKQPLAIWQFVPCKLVDGVWITYDSLCCGRCADGSDDCIYLTEHREYQESKSRCIFDGFEIRKKYDTALYLVRQGELSLIYDFKKGFYFMGHPRVSKIEDLVKYKLELTATAIKELGL